MQQLNLSLEEIFYLKATSLLRGDAYFRYEINHLHRDLQQSSQSCHNLSPQCLTKALEPNETYTLDKEKAVSILEKQVNHHPSAFILGFVNEMDGKAIEAYKLYNMSKEYAPSMVRIGVMLALGKVKDSKYQTKIKAGNRALELGEEALRNGYIHANNFLGTLYYNEIGKTAQMSESERILEANTRYEYAASFGCTCSLLNLGINCKNGYEPFNILPEEERLQKAYDYFDKAASKEDPGAFYRIAKMTKEGQGPTKGMSLGKRLRISCEYFKKAKEGRVQEVDSKLIEEWNKIVKYEGYFVQEILDTLFYNLMYDEKSDLRIIEGEDFLLYCEKGFNLDLFGTFLQGKMDKLYKLGEKAIIPEFKELDWRTIDSLPSSYKGRNLYISNVFIDFSSIINHPGVNKTLSCFLIQ